MKKMNLSGDLFNRKSQKGLRTTLRREQPEAEKLLWGKLRNRQFLGYKFRRQYGIGNYVVDFYCPELKLAIEIDGERISSKVLRKRMQNDRPKLKVMEYVSSVLPMVRSIRILMVY